MFLLAKAWPCSVCTCVLDGLARTFAGNLQPCAGLRGEVGGAMQPNPDKAAAVCSSQSAIASLPARLDGLTWSLGGASWVTSSAVVGGLSRRARDYVNYRAKGV